MVESGEDFNDILDKTEGYSGAHMVELIDYAKTIAADNGIEIQEAINISLQKLTDQRNLIYGLREGKSIAKSADDVEIKDGEDLITIPDSLFEPAEEKDAEGDKITIDKSDLQNLLMTTMKDVLTRNRTQKAKDTVDAVKAGIDKAKGKV